MQSKKSYLKQCLKELEENNLLIRIRQEVDPNVEIAAIHLENFKNQGGAILFENIKGCQFKAVSNLYGNPRVTKFLFRKTLDKVSDLVDLKNNPTKILKQPIKSLKLGFFALNSLPKRVKKTKYKFKEALISDLPQIKCWPDDGGAFITLPQVFTTSPSKKGIRNSNIGMYRVQLSGNQYFQDEEIGLHYQIHRGIGVHHQEAIAKKEPLKVSIFIGGPPAHSVGAVMPLPEGISEVFFNGALSGRRFKYFYEDGYLISADADFVITGKVDINYNKPEGPFGDHLGYYSLKHDFPVLKVHKVYHKPDAIYPFTVVGRPPQEDTQFGKLVHYIAKNEITNQIPGLKELNAVDQAGVHPLLLAIGKERYAPYKKLERPEELLTIANHLLGFGQLSLAKYLFITNYQDDESLSTKEFKSFFIHILRRVKWERDLHFYTNFTIDTLDYSSEKLNYGSKLVVAAIGKPIYNLCSSMDKLKAINFPSEITLVDFVFDGIFSLSVDNSKENNVEAIISEIEKNNELEMFESIRMLILTEDSKYLAENIDNFLWITFTRSNPATDVQGLWSFTENKHWGCKGPLIIDARKKTHHASELIMSEEVKQNARKILSSNSKNV